MIFKAIKTVEKVDKENILISDDGRTWDNEYELKMVSKCLNNVGTCSFPNRNSNWNDLEIKWCEQGTSVISIHNLESKLD